MRNIDHLYYGIHECVQNESTQRFTKIELFVLTQPQARTIIEANAKCHRPLCWSDVEVLPNSQYALHLKAQAAKQSDDVSTEIFSRLMRYSNGVYFFRSYKLIDKNFYKCEVTRVPLKQKPYLDPEETVSGLLKFMHGMTRGAQHLLLPNWMHDGTYETIPEFLEKARVKPTK